LPGENRGLGPGCQRGGASGKVWAWPGPGGPGGTGTDSALRGTDWLRGMLARRRNAAWLGPLGAGHATSKKIFAKREKRSAFNSPRSVSRVFFLGRRCPPIGFGIFLGRLGLLEKGNALGGKRECLPGTGAAIEIGRAGQKMHGRCGRQGRGRLGRGTGHSRSRGNSLLHHGPPRRAGQVFLRQRRPPTNFSPRPHRRRW